MAESKRFVTWDVEQTDQRHNGYNFLRVYRHRRYGGQVFIRDITQYNFTNLNNKNIEKLFRYPFAQQFKKSLEHLKPEDRQFNSREDIAKQVAKTIFDEWLKMITESIIDGKTYSCSYFDIKVGYRLLTNKICKFSRDGRTYFPIINIKKGVLKIHKGCAMAFTSHYYKILKAGLLNGKTYSMPLSEIKRKEFYLKRKEYGRLRKQQ